MLNENGSGDNEEITPYSDADISSIGSSESDSDAELPLPADINLDTKFFQNKTPIISRHVLNYDKTELEQINMNLQSNSDNLHQSNQEIGTNILELKKSQDQLHKLIGETNTNDSCPKSNSQLFDQEIEQSPIKKGIYQQIKQANFQLDKVQEQLFHFFDGINKISEIFADSNDEDNSKLTEKANKVKEISDHIQQSQTNPSFSCEETSHEKQPESFEVLCTRANNVITELSNIMQKLNELLEM